ncbi:MAG: hypothetical protein JW820_15475, partial [Spirochaetales bacterium]|nr:hypothetical protein [Spirochaetales bacterium]
GGKDGHRPDGPRRVRWGLSPEGEELFVPLARSLLLSGRSEPSGRPPVQAGEPTASELERLLVGELGQAGD